ncbi:sigma-54-dependent transcriptional regulator [Magnetococcales bacterium HHB-1]
MDMVIDDLEPSTLLLVEDSEAMAAVYLEYLSKTPWETYHVTTGAEAFKRLKEQEIDLILLDLQLPDIHGMDILKEIQTWSNAPEVIIITAHGSVDLAVAAMRQGVCDFIEKPFEAHRLLVTIKNTLKNRQLNQIINVYRKQFDRKRFHGFIGASLPMQRVYRIIESAANSRATIFITGESGTGKEVCAEAIHLQSSRSHKKMVAINCAAIPMNLLESEVFGHVRGAFTGAVSDRVGAATEADKGTLFLDEICELNLELQSKLLRFIQTGTFQKVGSTKTEQVDVRILCATNRDPWQEVKEGRFREDLYYRLHVIPLSLPALRERDGDILLIAQQFLRKYAKEEGKTFKSFHPEVKAKMLSFQWPGNIRQLQNIIRQIVVLHQGGEVLPAMLPMPLSGETYKSGVKNDPFPPQEEAMVSSTVQQSEVNQSVLPLWKMELVAIERALQLCDNNVPKAASLLEVNPSTIYRKRSQLKKLDGITEA